MTNQHAHLENPSHYLITGLQIWDETDGTATASVAITMDI